MDLSTAATRDAAEVLDRALAGEADAVAGTFHSVVAKGGVTSAYDVAWCLAQTTVGDQLARGPWRLEFPDIDQAPYEARWVARFLSAYANGDPGTGTALCRAAQSDGHLTDCLLTLAGSAAATLRRRFT
ncbi:hypothetical protein JQS43_25025 [Natronosporangium hydrolyticum]|uniref:Uncharacterized protein n=1 Tax=Natronosporangium hydrolyticum TaxID=2811111 RepID=A0A895YB90_9ACTN|nr:hypothetical protein [Natronosporangium hydrolyticum]QSB14681.1 hypothetical protein JQS43_25025 [Natronosporangium hydrolyticum]